MPLPTPPPKPPPPGKPSSSIWPVLLVALVVLLGLIALVFLTLGIFGPVILIGLAVFGIAGMHYLVWGKWLSKMIQDAEAGSEDDDSPDPPSRGQR